jgi:hypothetical protein
MPVVLPVVMLAEIFVVMFAVVFTATRGHGHTGILRRNDRFEFLSPSGSIIAVISIYNA